MLNIFLISLKDFSNHIDWEDEMRADEFVRKDIAKENLV